MAAVSLPVAWRRDSRGRVKSVDHSLSIWVSSTAIKRGTHLPHVVVLTSQHTLVHLVVLASDGGQQEEQEELPHGVIRGSDKGRWPGG